MTGEHKKKIKAISPDIELVEIPADEVKDNPDYEVVLAEGGNRVHYHGELDWEDYQKFYTRNLQWVQLCSTGFSDNITPQVLDGSVTLTNAPGLHTNPIAESVLAAMLDHAKLLKQRRLDQVKHKWNQLKCDELYNRTALIIGLGNIGGKVAKLCKAFNMKVIGTKRKLELVENVDGVFPTSDLKKYLPEADYIVISAPLTPETENLISREELESMKNSAYLINIGRGKIVDEPSLIQALEKKWIAGAYLDCLVVEPLPVDHVFWDMDNVFVVPHDSHSSPYIGDRILDMFCDNLKRYVAGEKLENICDPKKGY